LSAEVSLLDPPPPPAPTTPEGQTKTKKARKGQSDSLDKGANAKVPDFVCEKIGSSGWIHAERDERSEWREA